MSARPPSPSPPRPAQTATSELSSHPTPTRREEVVETLHGVPVADPYRWLEDANSEEVRAWSEAQTAHAEGLLVAQRGFGELSARLDVLMRIGTVEPPLPVRTREGIVRYFYRRQGPKDDQPALYVLEGPNGTERLLLDPNRLSEDGTVAIDWWVPSWDGRFIAYGLSEGGNEDSTLRVLVVETGRNLGETEVIPRVRYASVAWLPDSSGFYYPRYPAEGSVPKGEEHYHKRIYLHRIGTPHEHDQVVFGEGRPMTDTPSIDISPNGRFLLASVHRGWSRRDLYLLDRASGPLSTWIPLAVPDEDAIYEAAVFDDHLLVRTNDGASTYRLYRVDPLSPGRDNWQPILPPEEQVLASATQIGGDIFAVYIADAHSVIKRFAADGTPKGAVPLPMLGTVPEVIGEPDGEEAFFAFISFTVPTMILRLDLRTGQTSLWAEVKPPIDPTEFIVTQERVISKDGTSIPIFISRRKDVPRNGSAPVLLGGYGGFNISQMPSWSGARYAFMERGGVVVTANLRGGGEYGEAWHRAGMLANKQNVFDDLIAVAEHLVRTGVSAPDRLAIIGGSNGGLLVGAAITQRPELFRAAVCTVPLLDMIRYHRFLIARLWIPEYGSSDDPAQFQWLYAYSPYHRVTEGTHYPAVFFSTAESDTRVDPLHARKMAALLQWSTGSDRPILLRIESKAGHGAGKPISKRIDEAKFVYAFLFWQLEMS